jgi:ABC-type multidrug transport system ATPase subunit
MNIVLDNTGKKFNTEWIFRNLSRTFEQGKSYAILGKNGSGKSTLLQIIAGNLHATAGSIKYFEKEQEIHQTRIFQFLSIVAPYQELIEEFTLSEMLKFHFSFKQLVPGNSISKLNEMLGFRNIDHKQLKLFSSGMKQRVKIILAMLSNTPLLLLDEPTTNLDQTGIGWYLDLVRNFSKDRIVIVCSNLQQQETSFCSEKLLMEDYK